MTRGQLITLAVAAFVMTALAITTPWRQDVTEPVAHGLLYPELASRLNDIARVTVHSAGKESVILERRADGWVVSNRGGYPADIGPLREGLLALSRAELLQAMTRDPERYAMLNVLATEQPEAASQEVILRDPEGSKLAHVILGETSDGGGSYVRRADEARSWLVSEQISFPGAVADWLAKDLVDIPADRLSRIEMQPAKGPRYTLVKSGSKDAEFKVQEVPAGHEPLSFEISDVAAALEGLELSDVRPEGEAPQTDDPWNVGRFKTFDGLVIETQTRKAEGKNFLKLSASFDPATAQDAPGIGEEKTKQKSNAKSQVSASQDPKSQAQALNQRFEGWVFIVPEQDASALSMSRDELLEERSPES